MTKKTPAIKKQVGRDCSCCDWFKELPGKELETDFGFCFNPKSEVHYQVLFEHFQCKKSKEKYDKN
jgi:hypothetical protein